MSEAGADFGWIDNLGLQRKAQDILLGIQKKDDELGETTPRLPCGRIHPKDISLKYIPRNLREVSHLEILMDAVSL